MVYNASKLIQEAFEDNKIKCRINETKSTSAVEAGYSGSNVSGITMRFISTDDDNDVACRIFSFLKVPESKRGAVLEAMNTLQRKYRYVTFTLDDDNEIHIGHDLPVRTVNVGDVCVEMFIRMAKIADDAYPIFMKAIWS